MYQKLPPTRIIIMMRKPLLIFMLLLIGITSHAKDNLEEEITYKNNQILIDGKYVAKYNTQTKDINLTDKEKITVYDVSIFKKDGKLLANFALHISGKSKKQGSKVLKASLKTISDNVTHNGANFIKNNIVVSNEAEIPQFDQIIKYLLSYNYI